MKMSLKWLSDYIDIKDYFANPQELANKLTAAGIEVESIENLAKQYSDVVVGHILEKGQHPNADRLSLCQVSTGDGVVHQIVCGAQNHKTGDNVVVALPGAILPGDFAIKKSKIRGVESGGMLCSTKELGLASDPFAVGGTPSDGILILPTNAPVGQPFAEYMGFDDIVFELKVTPNRADCLSHWGLAREIATLLGREIKSPLKSVTETSGFSTKSRVALDVKTSELAPRFTGRSVRGVKVGASPGWLRKRLESVGLKSINNIVDVTNFVMMELGQPLHAYDHAELKGGKMSVELSKAGEKFVSLDGAEHTLTGDELMIRDGERAVGMAGIVGGQNSGIKDSTTEVFIEGAYFTPSQIRRASRRMGIETDASYRFSRGVNPEAVALARDRAAELIVQVAGGEIAGEAYDIYPKPFAKWAINVKLQDLSDRLGYVVNETEFVEWMKRLGCEVTDIAGGEWSIQPPLFRVDIALDVDLVEEFARLHGYQHIPENLPGTDVAPGEHSSAYILERKVRRLWQAQGFHQAINYAFLGASYQEKIMGRADKMKGFGLQVIPQAIALVNPLNEELGTLRTSLMPGLLRNVTYNARFGLTNGCLFEVGFAHSKIANGYAQESRLGLAVWGQADSLWQKDGMAPQVFALKSAIENFLKSLGYAKWKWTNAASGLAPDFIHPGQCAALFVEGKTVGFVGTLHPSLAAEFKLREGCALSELNLDLLSGSLSKTPKFKSISKQPAIDRDIALLMPKTLAAADVEDVIRKTGGALLVDVSVFDTFEGGSVPAGQRSVAFRLIFQDPTATLEDAKVNELRDTIVGAVSQKYGLSLR